MTFRKMTAFIIILLTLILLGGCSKGSNPEDAFNNYAQSWEEKDFSSMYEGLSEVSKEYITQEEYLDRYQNIYQGIGAENIKITMDEQTEIQEDEKGNVRIPFNLQMETIAGHVEFNQVAILVQGAEKNWTIEWRENMIFPAMEKGDRIRVETIPAKRGEIHDRNGMALATNGEVQMIGMVPQDLGENSEATKETLAKEFQMSLKEVDSKLNASWVSPDLFVPIGSLSSDENKKIRELTSLPGVMAQKQSARVYPFKETSAHLIGYIGRINQEELEKLKGQGYHENSTIGKTGIELHYEEELRAVDGKAIHIVDESNNVKETIIQRSAQNGKDIQLTIDATLQRNIYREMEGEKGTTVVMHPKTGEVLALSNSPSYDPNDFILGLSSQQWTQLNEDEDKPLLNRFSSTYAPGSIFKPITASVAIEKGALDPNASISISGLKWQKNPSWGDYHITRVNNISPINLKDALIYSDNIYFAMAALELGEKLLIEGGESFGIGESIPFEFPIRSSQIMNEQLSGEIQLADSGYGQGEVAVSPLHISTMFTAFLNDGNMVQPSLLLKEGITPNTWKEGIISAGTANLIKDALIQVVEHPQGTGRAGKIPGYTLGGKTGTAELKSSQGGSGKENGWFISFEGDGKVLVTMMLEDVGEKGGSAYVVPKVKKIIENFLSTKE